MIQLTNSWWRFLPVAALLVGTTLLLQVRNRAEFVPQGLNLAAVPERVGNWVGEDEPPSAGVLQVLGPGEFLMRDYQQPSGGPDVNLFLAYFPSQRAGDTIHSPKNCLPGAGWTPLESGRMPLSKPNGQTILVNRYVVARSMDRALVLYWYQAHGRVVASEYWAKFYLIADAIRLNRSDGAMVRVVTPFGIDESEASAQQRAVAFARELLPSLDRSIPN